MIVMKPFLTLFAALSLGLGTSCTTMYDSYGRPQEVVTPEGVAVAALAAGVLGYAIGDNQNSRGHYHGGHRYGHGHGHGGGYGGGYGGYGGYHR
jgi:hypothetical protein